MPFYTEVHTEQQYRLGKEVKSAAGETYIYLPGVASNAAGQAVVFDEAFAVTRTVAASQGPLAIAMAAVDATTKFGWYMIEGKATVKVLAAFADNSNIYTTSTDGSLDDSGAGAEEFVFGATGRSAIDTPATGYAYIQIRRPWKGTATLD